LGLGFLDIGLSKTKVLQLDENPQYGWSWMKYILIKCKNIIYKIVNDLRPNIHEFLDPNVILHELLDPMFIGVIEKPLWNKKFELVNLTFFRSTPRFFRNILRFFKNYMAYLTITKQKRCAIRALHKHGYFAREVISILFQMTCKKIWHTTYWNNK